MNVGYPTLEGASIPGDPEGLAAIASQLQAAHDDVSTVQERVAVDGVVASWEGAAADRFRSSLNKLPGELGTVASAFDAASSGIRSFAGQLIDFQNNASYYANRIKSLEEELHSSQRRHDEAQAEVDSARLRESAATDPISLKTAVDAVKGGLSKLQLALDDVEANRGELERIRREAQTNREDYEQAVRACCTALQDATESTTHSNGAPHIAVATLIAGAVSGLLHDVRDHEPATPTTTQKTTPQAAQKVAPAPKPTSVTSAPVAAVAVGTGRIAEQAEKAWSEHGQYVYTESVPARENHGTLYGAYPRYMDCSAFAELCLKEAGIPDPSGKNYEPIGDTHTLIAGMEPVSAPEPGDLAFFGTPPADPDHVVVYIGNGESIGMENVGLNMQRGNTMNLGIGAGQFLGYYRPKA